MRAGTILPLIFITIINLQCSAFYRNKNNENNELLSLLLTSSAVKSCWLWGQSFLTTGGITCADGTASGTGLLTASTDSASVLSLEITFKLDNSGEFRLYGAGNRSALSTTSAYYSFTPTGSTAYHFDSPYGADVGYVPGMEAVTYCLEINTVAIPPQLRARNTACPPGTSSIADATFNSVEAGLQGTSAAQGTGWGIHLSAATIKWLSLNPVQKFPD